MEALLVVVAVVSLIVNISQARKIEDLKKQRRAEKRMQKTMTKALVDSACVTHRKLGKALEHIKRLEDQLDVAADYLENFRDKAIDATNKYNAVHDSYMTLSGTLCDLVREGRIIKSRYLNKVLTYEFNSLTKEETEMFFGKQII